VTNRLRIILDTNVIISAVLFPYSMPKQAFDSAFLIGSVLASVETLTELADVLHRPKFDRYVSSRNRRLFLTALIQEVSMIDVTAKIIDSRDPKDNKFLELAVSGNADMIISGDSHLLELHPFRGILILTPQSFLQTYEQ
jgi:uncharacterized protein